MKVCATCGEAKPRARFSRRSASTDGLRGQCKDCVSAYQKGYRAANTGRWDAYQRAYYRANAERLREHARTRYASDPGPALASVARRRARLRGADSDGTDPTWEKVAARDGLECAYCPTVCDPASGRTHPTHPTLDHVVPVSKGGAHSMSNAVLACWACNNEKRAMIL